MERSGEGEEKKTWGGERSGGKGGGGEVGRERGGRERNGEREGGAGERRGGGITKAPYSGGQDPSCTSC